MKKILSLFVSALMLTSLCACGKDEDSGESSDKIVVSDSSADGSAVSEKVGYILTDEFHSMLEENPDMSAQAVADALMAHEAITFKAMTMPVENGLLTGFGNTEIKGFKEGVMFGPAISSIPFIGYIFVIEEDTDLISFMKTLIDNADKRWNVCTEADNVDIDNVGNTVILLMSPDKLEEE